MKKQKLQKTLISNKIEGKRNGSKFPRIGGEIELT
jgi:hypothetical protein